MAQDGRQFGLRLRALRVLSGRPVKDIAEDLGLSAQAWYSYEDGRSAFAVTLVPKIAQALGVPTERLTERLFSDNEYVMAKEPERKVRRSFNGWRGAAMQMVAGAPTPQPA